MPESEVGTVTHFFNQLSVATIKLVAPLKVGETIVIRGEHDDVKFRLDSMQIDRKNVPLAGPGQEVGVKVPGRVHEHSRVFVDRP